MYIYREREIERDMYICTHNNILYHSILHHLSSGAPAGRPTAPTRRAGRYEDKIANINSLIK